MKVLVCGGRDYTDYAALAKVLTELHGERNITEIIHGDARGADRMSGTWAAANNIPVNVFPACWNIHKNAAGAIRNHKMLAESKPDVVVAFAGGNGTKDMVKISLDAGVDVIDYNNFFHTNRIMFE